MVPFKTFRGPLFPNPVTGQELFFAVSYSKPALGDIRVKSVRPKLFQAGEEELFSKLS